MANVIHVHEQGGPEVLRYETRNVVEPGPREIRLRQTAIGVNYLDIYFRKGDFRPAGFPFIGGFEGAGTVETVGSEVTEVSVGDRVAYQLALGAYSDERLISIERVVKLPDAIGDTQAAAMMLKGTTAEYLLRRVYAVKPGDTILIHAAAGGVGSILCQWAKHLGATVIGTVSTEEKAELAKANGCDYPILYTREDFVERVNDITEGKGVPVIYDGVGKATFHHNFGCLAVFGTNVLFGWSSGKADPIDVHMLNAKSHAVVNPSLGHYTGARQLLLESTEALFDVVAKGAVKIPANHHYALKKVAQAHTDLEARRTTGSIILTP